MRSAALPSLSDAAQAADAIRLADTAEPGRPRLDLTEPLPPSRDAAGLAAGCVLDLLSLRPAAAAGE